MCTACGTSEFQQMLQKLCDRSPATMPSSCLLQVSSMHPLSTAYTVCEGLGFESGLDKGFKEAPFFYWFYTLLIVAGGAVVLIPSFPLVSTAILSQVLNGLLLPVVMFFMLRLVNNKELMGDHVNSHWFNAIAWLTTAVVITLSLLLGWHTIRG